MKILAISSNFPPDHLGGYGLRVKDILDELASRGHAVQVITTRSKGPLPKETAGPALPVVRKLHNRLQAGIFPKEMFYDLLDLKFLARLIGQFQPDAVYLGHTYILSKAILPFLARKNFPIIYDEGGSGLIEAWTDHGRWFRFTGDYRSRFRIINWIKPLVIRMVILLSGGNIESGWTWPKRMQVFFNSQLNRRNALEKGVPLDDARVIHSGIDEQLFSFQPRRGFGTPLQLFVPGRIEKRKGQKDAVELLKKLLEAGVDARLTLAGAKWVDGYYEEVLELAQKYDLMNQVTIHPMMSPAQLVNNYQQADICFFPSYFRTGFSRVPLEASACGSLLISYGNEGSDEIIRHEENGFILSAGDFEGMVRLIQKLISKPALVAQVIRKARQEIEDNYSMHHYVDQIESLLINTIEAD